MIQRTYKIHSYEELDNWLDTVKSSNEYNSAHSVLIKVLSTQVLTEDVKIARRKVREGLSKAKIVGMSLTNFGRDLENPDVNRPCDISSDDRYLIISCLYFDEADITVLEFGGSKMDYGDITLSLKSQLFRLKDIKAVEVLSTGKARYVKYFIEMLSEGLEDVPFFGAEAGVVEVHGSTCHYHSMIHSIDDKDAAQYIMGDNYYTDGVVLIVYCGKSLHFKVEYILGWKPLGKEMTITQTLGSTCIATIDQIPATQIYEKYLNVKPDKYLLYNICEFPFIINRDGLDIARVPPIYDEEGRLYFGSDVREGEKIRLSFGNLKEILNETWNASEEMRQFDPQAIMLIICGARTIFLKTDAATEIGYFNRFHPATVYCHGNTELYRYQGKGGNLNCSLVAIGLREGDQVYDDTIVEETKMPQCDLPRIIPLADRLANFLEATTDELKMTNYILQKVAVEAEAANKAKSQFLSSMSHEIRTPINAILGMNEMILRECKDETILEYAENVRSASNNLLGLINDVLDFSKIEAGKIEIIPVEYAISSVLNDLVNMIQKRAEKKNLKLIVNASPDLPTVLLGDEIRIKQVVTNILTNAVKYTEKGSVTLTADYEKVDDETIALHFSVKDTGIGIKAEDLPKLFSAFERIEEERNRSIEGTGLGMNITQKLLQLMGSKLEVSSVYGEGSNFECTIKQRVINWEPIGNFEESYRHMISHHKAYHEKFTAPRARILVVDDNATNLIVVKGLLKQTKVQVFTAESGYECLHLVTKNHYDIIFLDHRMPGIDGIETMQKMKELPNNLNAETPVIALTANAVSGARAEYIAVGMDDYLTKPIDSAALESTIIKYLPEDKIEPASSEKQSEDDQSAADTSSELPDWLIKVDSIDAKEGIKHCGSAEGLIDALTVFAQSVASGVKEIARYFAESDWKNYTTKVHALKSSARVVGATELSERAKRLEDAGNHEYIDEIKKDTTPLLELYMSYEAKLSPLIKHSTDDANKPLIDAEALSEALDMLKGAAESFDYDEMIAVLDSLDEYKLPDDQVARFNSIKEAAAKLDWEKISELISAA